MNRNWIVAVVITLSCAQAWAGRLVDPTRPPWIEQPSANASHPSAGLQAILLDGPRKMALIDGRLWSTGTRIGAERVVAIHHNSVDLAGARGMRRIPLDPRRSDVKKTAVIDKGRP